MSDFEHIAELAREAKNSGPDVWDSQRRIIDRQIQRSPFGKIIHMTDEGYQRFKHHNGWRWQDNYPVVGVNDQHTQTVRDVEGGWHSVTQDPRLLPPWYWTSESEDYYKHHFKSPYQYMWTSETEGR